MAKFQQTKGERVDFDCQLNQKNIWYIELEVKTKLVLGLPRAKQVGL